MRTTTTSTKTTKKPMAFGGKKTATKVTKKTAGKKATKPAWSK